MIRAANGAKHRETGHRDSSSNGVFEPIRRPQYAPFSLTSRAPAAAFAAMLVQ
jgi:hypothetical protein